MKNKPNITGYIFANEKNDLLLNSKIGDIIQKEENPPFIVVDHFIYKVLVLRWPGRLFLVEVIDPVDNSKLGPGMKLRDGVHYTRTYGVKVLEELDSSKLFGENGKIICKILDKISILKLDDILELGKLDNKEANDLFSDGWNRWLKINDPNSSHLEYSHHCVIQIHTKKSSSPINHGFSIISSHYRERLKSLLGEEAFYIDEDGDKCMLSKWSSARTVLLSTAMAYGASYLFNESEVRIMTYAWEKLFQN